MSGSDSCLAAQRNLDSKLAFMSKLSFTFRQRLNGLHIGIDGLSDRISAHSEFKVNNGLSYH